MVNAFPFQAQQRMFFFFVILFFCPSGNVGLVCWLVLCSSFALMAVGIYCIA